VATPSGLPSEACHARPSTIPSAGFRTSPQRQRRPCRPARQAKEPRRLAGLTWLLDRHRRSVRFVDGRSAVAAIRSLRDSGLAPRRAVVGCRRTLRRQSDHASRFIRADECDRPLRTPFPRSAGLSPARSRCPSHRQSTSCPCRDQSRSSHRRVSAVAQPEAALHLCRAVAVGSSRESLPAGLVHVAGMLVSLSAWASSRARSCETCARELGWRP
jgi:hypothetical protein